VVKLVMNVFLIADLVFLDAHDVFARASGGPNQLIELDQDGFALRLGGVLAQEEHQKAHQCARGVHEGLPPLSSAIAAPFPELSRYRAMPPDAGYIRASA
jgi:hypothetical protein